MTTASNAPEYEKLARGVRRYVSPVVAPRFRLWLAKDHLLHICDTGYSESYKRFYFQDIQAIIVSETRTGTVISVSWGIVTVLMAALTFSGYWWWAWNVEGMVFAAAVAVFFLLALVINVLRGPTCECVLYTGVHAERIRALNRLRKARNILHRLQPLIESIQGALTDEQLAERRATSPTAVSTRRVAPPSARETDAPLRHDEGRWHALLFTMVLVGAASSALDLFTGHWIKNVFDTVWYLAVFLLAVTVIVKQAGTDLKAKLGGMAWAILLTVMASFFTASVYETILAMSDPSSARRAFDVITADDHPFFQAYSATICVLYSLLGIVGFLLLRDFRRTHRRVLEAARIMPERQGPEEA